MHLQSLTLRGFKSFASSTTLHFEPGITCVVGPNGSGKSNVVDALAWVMGEQGAKNLRGAKMEDVVFAGTAGRPPLGRAEVVLSIDNSDGALPLDYTEVTLSRTMFRSGGSEYAINGRPCRLLDVQELLADSGIGREMHVVVGQGQLDAILAASPEERRGFVEEAAGVLKHRKRKDKALRKLEAMQVNLTRLEDLTVELRRQLKPLGRQAEVAQRAAGIQADLRDARLRLLADDLLQQQTTLEQDLAAEEELRSRQAKVSAALRQARQRESEQEALARSLAERAAGATETWYSLTGVGERLRGLAELADVRARAAADVAAEGATPEGRDPDTLDQEAAAFRSQERALAAQVERDRAALERAVAARTAAEGDADAEAARLAALTTAAADRRAGLARLTGQVAGLRSRVAAAVAERDRLDGARAEALARAADARRRFTAAETRIAGLSAGEEGLDTEHDAAHAALAAVEDELSALQQEERDAERERATLAARREALELALARRDGSAAVLAAGDRLPGVVGSLAALVAVEPGAEAAVAAALGAAGDAVAVDSLGSALDCVRLLREEGLGRAGLLVAGEQEREEEPAHVGWPVLPGGLRYAVDGVEAPPQLRPVLARMLDHVVLVDDLPAARALVEQLPRVVAATRDGDVVGADLVRGGSDSAQSRLEVQAAAEDTAQHLAQAAHRVERVRFAAAQLQRQRETAAADAAAALARLHESDAELSAVAEQLGQLGHVVRSAVAEAERLGDGYAAAAAAAERAAAELETLESRLRLAEQTSTRDVEPSTVQHERLVERARACRASELDARLALRPGEERARALAGRAEGLERAAAAQREARDRAAQRRASKAVEAAHAAVVARGAQRALNRLTASLDAAARERAQAEQDRQRHEDDSTDVRQQARTLAAELDELTSSVHADELVRAEQRLRIEQLVAKALEDYGVEADALVREWGPHVPVPAPAAEEQAPPAVTSARPFVRAEQERRAHDAERQLAVLGRVNPLALEEYAAMAERQRFLAEQLEDLRQTRRDLLEIVAEVDERVQEVFATAYADTAREFAGVFARLFPGGEGRLLLTDPQDMLVTGVDVEARPPGKKVKRLSLLSGGERSLVAVAFLIALFRARPSPFYVLDEVEAALDDTNLGRLLEIYAELRESSQLIVVTHQKRTMEIADALYGVSMRGDGVTTVISQRLREAQPA